MNVTGAVGAVVSIVHVRVAGVASTFPAPSTAAAVKACAPSARSENVGLAVGQAPLLFEDAGPGCVRGKCPEGEFGCGKAAEVRKAFKAMRATKEGKD